MRKTSSIKKKKKIKQMKKGKMKLGGNKREEMIKNIYREEMI